LEMTVKVWSFTKSLLWTLSSFEPPSNLLGVASWEVYKTQGKPKIRGFGGPFWTSFFIWTWILVFCCLKVSFFYLDWCVILPVLCCNLIYVCVDNDMCWHWCGSTWQICLVMKEEQHIFMHIL
jgi:hypothetical protein